MPVRAVHHSTVVRAVHHRASATVNRMRAAISPSKVLPRFPIPLLLPCEILLKVVDDMPPEAAVCLVCTCKHMRGLYSEDGIYPSDALWTSLLARTFPVRLTGAPGPNAPPRLKGTDRQKLCAYSAGWVQYARALRAVRRPQASLPPQGPRAGEHPQGLSSPHTCVGSASTSVPPIHNPRARVATLWSLHPVFPPAFPAVRTPSWQPC